MLRLASILISLTFTATAAFAQSDDPDSLAADTVAVESPAAPPSATADTIGIAPPAATSRRDDEGEEPSPTALRGKGRPNPIKALVDGAKNYVSDAIWIYTSPLRMSWENVAIAGGVGAIGTGMYAYDQEIYDGFRRSRGDPIYESVVIDAGNFLEPLGLISATHWYLTGASVAGWIFDVPLLRTIPGEIMESNSIIGLMRQPIESISGRDRPAAGYGPSSFKGGRSLPSGHASVICETAAILSHHAGNPILRSVIWSGALAACLQRIDTTAQPRDHWASDIWLGAAIGTWGGHTIAVRNQQRRHGIKQPKWYDILDRGERDWSAMPVIGEDYRGLAFRMQF